MLAGMSLGTDIKRYSRGVLPRVAIITILFLPLLYGALYLWTFWNPFGEVNKIPAAIVNEDAGYTVSGKELQIGQQVESQLVSSGELDLKKMSASEARKKLLAGDVYFTVTIPENFSQAIASPASLDATQAKIEFAFNDTNNYISRIIGESAASKVQNKVNAAIGEQIVTQALAAAKQAGPKLNEAVDGINELNDGMKEADGGSQQLADGTDQLNTAVDGAVAKVEALTRDGQPLDPARISAIARTVDDIANRIAAIPTVTDDLDRLTSDIVGVQNFIYESANGIDEGVIGELIAAQMNALGDRLGAAADRTSDAAARAETAPPDTVVGVLNAVHEDAVGLAADIENPDSQIGRLLALLTQGGLEADLSKATEAAGQLNSGANQLSEGLDKLASGTGELAGKVDAAAQAIPHIDSSQAESLAKTLGEPVTIGETALNEAKTFGDGFAPFFLGLALYVGAIVMWMLLTPVQSRAVVAGLSPFRAALASYWPAITIGIGQSIIMYLVVVFAVGMRPEYPIWMFLFILLISATWMAMIQMFNAVFGTAVGRVVTLAILMVMLVASGGIYPVQTTAKLMQWVHPFDPMTYSVNGLRQLTVGGIDGRMPQAIAVLGGILIASVIITSLCVRRDRRYTMARLYPPIEV